MGLVPANLGSSRVIFSSFLDWLLSKEHGGLDEPVRLSRSMGIEGSKLDENF
jgi:hypothetical protein